ncbi:MAG: FAD binding domain-containing protein [Planctomycetes bacterium]|nr:FAD binding domain-containing protein [Planctomycetota bacterium]
MRNFDYYLPSTTSEAQDVLKKVKGARAKAGGTDLMGLLKDRLTAPDSVVSLDNVGELTGIKERDGGVWIGATTTIATVAANKTVHRGGEAVAEAAARTGTPLIRNRATVGGNLCQRPRCWYFRHPDYPCSKKGGETCYAQEGENKYHAIFDNVTCNIIHPSNLAPALWAHDAKIHVLGANGKTRDIGIDEFWVLPEEDMSKETVLEDGDLVTGVTYTPGGRSSGSAYVEVREKQSYDWALTNAAARIDLSGSRVKDVRLVISAVAPVPMRREDAEAVLKGKAFSEDLAWKAGEAAVADATPLRDNKYKVRLLKATVAHTLIAAAQRAKGGK